VSKYLFIAVVKHFVTITMLSQCLATAFYFIY